MHIDRAMNYSNNTTPELLKLRASINSDRELAKDTPSAFSANFDHEAAEQKVERITQEIDNRAEADQEDRDFHACQVSAANGR